jgi:hypothetical protein
MDKKRSALKERWGEGGDKREYTYIELLFLNNPYLPR